MIHEKLVNHNTCNQIEVGVFVVDPLGRILLKQSLDGSWSIPSGKLRKKEFVEVAARRNVMEQTGLAVGELRLIDVIPWTDSLNAFSHPSFVTFVTKDIKNIVKPNTSRIRFFKSTALPNTLIQGVKKFLQTNYLELIYEIRTDN